MCELKFLHTGSQVVDPCFKFVSRWPGRTGTATELRPVDFDQAMTSGGLLHVRAFLSRKGTELWFRLLFNMQNSSALSSSKSSGRFAEPMTRIKDWVRFADIRWNGWFHHFRASTSTILLNASRSFVSITSPGECE